MVLLGGYRWQDRKLYYTASSLKAFGLLKMEEEDGTAFMVQHKLHWVEVPSDNLFVIGRVVGEGVESCGERLCTGVVSFFEQDVGGGRTPMEIRRSFFIRGRNKVAEDPRRLPVVPTLDTFVN